MEFKCEEFVGIWHDAYSSEWCNDAIAKMEQGIQSGLSLTRQESDQVVSTVKDDTQIFTEHVIMSHQLGPLANDFTRKFWHELYPMYTKKFGGLNEADPHAIYHFKMQKTLPGQGYHTWHAENASRLTCNRILAYSLYLNDIDEGGETEFLYLHKRFKPKQGTFLLWPAGFTHTHRGNPPLKQEKYIITGWVEY